MLIRLALFITLILAGVAVFLYIVTRDPKYPRLAWQVLRFMGYVLLVFLALYLLERYGLVAWRVLV